jgi:hypothetical protein
MRQEGDLHLDFEAPDQYNVRLPPRAISFSIYRKSLASGVRIFGSDISPGNRAFWTVLV